MSHNHNQHNPQPQTAKANTEPSNNDDSSMKMYFHLTNSLGEFLFPGFTIDSALSFLLFNLFIIALVIFKEYIYMYRLQRSKRQDIPINQLNNARASSGLFHLGSAEKDSLFYGLNQLLSYLVMLIFMTFNLVLCLVVIVTSTLAYHYFHQKYSFPSLPNNVLIVDDSQFQSAFKGKDSDKFIATGNNSANNANNNSSFAFDVAGNCCDT
jgi:hypothetical protein